MSDGDFDRNTGPARLYKGDLSLLNRRARIEAARRDRDVTIAELVHEQLAELRMKDRQENR